MAIDIDKEMGELFPLEHHGAHDELLGEYMDRKTELFERILRERSLSGFRSFYDRFRDDPYLFDINCEDFKSIFGDWWLSHLEIPHLQWIYRRYLHVSRDVITLIGDIVTNRRIAAKKRAVFGHAMFDCRDTAARSPRGFIGLPFFWHCDRVICGQIMDVKSCREHRLIRRIGVRRHDGFRASAALEGGVGRDSFAVFELNREIEDRPIDDSMLEHLIRRDAARCFAGLLAHRPEAVFKLRTPGEWLLTVCRYAKDGLAVAAVNELEREFPGVVRRTRDPWGNTPLWNTFFNLEPTEKLRAELIRFGCDPDEKNEWGLSYQMLRDNAPGWYDHENEREGGWKWR